ncbi:MAG: hypothetical protein F6J94_05650 [Moorea sp. SIO1F2]|uniref:hypothetical protein n=1 Tax=unclassified Moorena TaxID=2683338 RepID=UPI0013B85313|nr:MULTISPECIES: hypothetical protein [unclassified Moorena]NEO04182.1 hypothetical protein [Moorena sp. SIO3I8]NEO21802.1 hypothetical protein [Moorena sp. SIO4A5]NEQ57915.1 hypothetical protein [Moorena sp. SIO4A1]NET81453.1 hypothetical protein [Moorena sp. SIO1F2]
MSTVLTYTFNPTTVQANTRKSFTLVATNGSTPLSLNTRNAIYLAVPVGDEASDLTPNLNEISTQAPDKWRFNATNQGGEYNFIISPTQNFTINANASLVFELNNVIINPVQGNAKVVLEEFVQMTPGQTEFTIQKNEAQLSIVAQAIPSTVGRNQTTDLKWNAAKAAYVIIQPINKQVDTSGEYPTTPSQDVTPEAPQVTYSLTAWTPDQKFARDNVTVTISPPVFRKVEPQNQPPIDLDAEVKLEWNVEYAETVQLTLPQGVVPQPTSGSLEVKPQQMLVGNAESVTYTWRATGADQPVFASVEIPFNPVTIDYFRYPNFETTNTFQVQVTNGFTNVEQHYVEGGSYFKLTATGPRGPLVQYLGDYEALQIQVFLSSSNNVSPGTEVELQWQTVLATSLSLESDDGCSTPISHDQIARGKLNVTPTQSTLYTLKATDANDNIITSQLQVTVS